MSATVLPELTVYTVAEVAEILRCSEDHVCTLVRTKSLKKVAHMGRRVLITKAALEAFLAAP